MSQHHLFLLMLPQLHSQQRGGRHELRVCGSSGRRVAPCSGGGSSNGRLLRQDGLLER